MSRNNPAGVIIGLFIFVVFGFVFFIPSTSFFPIFTIFPSFFIIIIIVSLASIAANNRRQNTLKNENQVNTQRTNPYRVEYQKNFKTSQYQRVDEEIKLIILLPGVPSEMREMMQDGVVPYLAAKVRNKDIIRSKVLKILGIGESEAEEKIPPSLLHCSNPTLGLLAKEGEVHLRITAKFPPEVVDDRIKQVEDYSVFQIVKLI